MIYVCHTQAELDAAVEAFEAGYDIIELRGGAVTKIVAGAKHGRPVANPATRVHCVACLVPMDEYGRRLAKLHPNQSQRLN